MMMPGSAPFMPPSPAGCTATETVLDDKNHQIAMTPLTTRQLHFVNGQWQKLPEKDRETRQNCMVEDDKTVDGDETVLWTVSLTPQSDGTLRGLSTGTVISSECGEEGAVHTFPFTATRVGDVPSGVTVADPSTVDAPSAPAAPKSGPVFDGTYRLDYDFLHEVNSRGPPNLSSGNEVYWWAFRSVCTDTGCMPPGQDSMMPTARNPVVLRKCCTSTAPGGDQYIS